MQNQGSPKFIKLILWAALFMTNFIYIGMMTLMPGVVGSSLPTDILMILGIVFVILSFFIPKFITPDNALPQTANVPFILSLAINESASILAFIIGFIGQDVQKAYLLFAVSMIGFVFKFPKDVFESANDKQKENKLDL